MTRFSEYYQIRLTSVVLDDPFQGVLCVGDGHHALKQRLRVDLGVLQMHVSGRIEHALFGQIGHDLHLLQTNPVGVEPHAIKPNQRVVKPRQCVDAQWGSATTLVVYAQRGQ